MRLSLVGLLGMVSTAAVGGAIAPMSWSQDGRWVAYTVSTGTEPPTLAPGWMFEVTGGGAFAESLRDVVGPGSTRLYRIYAADAETGSAVLLEESRGPLTSPAWSPDGRSLAFGRVVEGGPGAARFEVVIQDAPGRDRVLVSQPVVDLPAGRNDRTATAPAWSPDGRYLAVPDLNGPSTLSVVQVDNGRVFKPIDGSAPAWSPDGTRLAFIRTERTASLLVIDVELGRAEKSLSPLDTELNFGPPRHLVDLGQPYQSPVWSRDGKSVLAVARRVVVRGRGPTLQVDLLRARVDPGSVETVAHLTADPIEEDKSFLGVCLGHDRDLDEMFYSVDVSAQPTSIVWFRPRTQETVDRFNPVNISVRVASLSFSPNARTLAIRFGKDSGAPTTALYDVWSKRLTLLASDDPSRLEWIALLIANARQTLRVTLPPAEVAGQPLERPTILPVPGEIPSNQEVLVRLQRIGRLGRPLCEPGRGIEGDDPKVGAFLNEARFFFDALREDYPAALTSLETLEAQSTLPDHLERLLALRAQLYLGLGDTDRATDTIGFLRSIEEVSVSRFEVSPAGTTLTPEPVAMHGWARYLTARLDDLTASDSGANARLEESNGRLNPGPPLPAPVQGIPFELLPNGVFVIPRDGPPPAPINQGLVPRARIVRPRPIPPLPPGRPLPPFRLR